MNKLSPNHIDHCTRRIAKWAKAIRLIHALELNLPETFPEPDTIEPGRKPFDLRIIWITDNRKHAKKLCEQIRESLGFGCLWWVYNKKITGTVMRELRGRVRLGERTTMNLQLLVKQIK
jgi:hypothetical protein